MCPPYRLRGLPVPYPWGRCYPCSGEGQWWIVSTPELAKARAGVQRLGFGLDFVSFYLALPGHHPDCNRTPDTYYDRQSNCESLCEGSGLEDIVHIEGYATPSPLHSGCYDVLTEETVYPIASHYFIRNTTGDRSIDDGSGPYSLKYPTRPLEDWLTATEGFRAPWYTTVEILERADRQEDWLWEPFVLFGGVTLLIADSGAGKSTFTTSLLDAVLRGEPFLDFPTHKARVFYISEESVKGIRRRVESPEPSALQTAPSTELIRWMYWGQKVKTTVKDANGATLKDGLGKDLETYSPITWEIIRDEVTKSIEQYRRTTPNPLPVLLVIDTLSFWLEMDDSNSATDVIKALKPLRAFAEELSIAILGLHHSNRQVEQAGKKNKVTYTGNMQWKAQSDIMLFLQYAPPDLVEASDDPRTLEMYKTRFDDVPDLRLRFTKSRGYYLDTSAPTPPVDTMTEIDRGVLAGYPRVKEGSISQKELAAELGVNPSQVSRSIVKLQGLGKVT